MKIFLLFLIGLATVAALSVDDDNEQLDLLQNDEEVSDSDYLEESNEYDRKVKRVKCSLFCSAAKPSCENLTGKKRKQCFRRRRRCNCVGNVKESKFVQLKCPVLCEILSLCGKADTETLRGNCQQLRKRCLCNMKSKLNGFADIELDLLDRLFNAGY